MIVQSKYLLCGYILLYFLTGWQYIIFKTHDSITPTRFMDMISYNVNVVGFAFILASLLGFVALIGHKILKRVWVAQLFLLPQLLISLSSAISMIVAVNSGQYNDGTVLPYHFILKDQEWCGIFFVFNLLSVIHYKF